LEQGAVVGLFFDGVGEEQVRFAGYQRFDRHLLHAQKYVAIRKVALQRDAVPLELRVVETADGRRLCHDAHWQFDLSFGTLLRGEGHTGIGGHFTFAQDANFNFVGHKNER
jgi:hypothetical protein